MDLITNNKIVVDWPEGKKLPKPGDRFDAGELGEAYVFTVQTGTHSRDGKFQRVELEIMPKLALTLLNILT